MNAAGTGKCHADALSPSKTASSEAVMVGELCIGTAPGVDSLQALTGVSGIAVRGERAPIMDLSLAQFATAFGAGADVELDRSVIGPAPFECRPGVAVRIVARPGEAHRLR